MPWRESDEARLTPYFSGDLPGLRGADRVRALSAALARAGTLPDVHPAALCVHRRRRDRARCGDPQPRPAGTPDLQRIVDCHGRHRRRRGDPACLSRTLSAQTFRLRRRCRLHARILSADGSAADDLPRHRRLHQGAVAFPQPVDCGVVADLLCAADHRGCRRCTHETAQLTFREPRQSGQNCTPRVRAPSTTRLLPVIKLAAGLAMNATAFAISCGVPILPVGPRASALTLATMMSMPPNSLPTLPTQAFRAGPSATSRLLPLAFTPFSRSAATALLTSAALRAQIATSAPSLASVCAMARPMPLVPPVTTAFSFLSPRSMPVHSLS